MGSRALNGFTPASVQSQARIHGWAVPVVSSTDRRISGVGQSFPSEREPCPGGGKAQKEALRRFCALRWNPSLWAAQLSIEHCGNAPLLHYLRPKPCMWPTARSLMTWVLLHNETHLPHATSAASSQASTTLEQDCSASRLIYLFVWGWICIFSAWTSVEHWLNQYLLQLHAGAEPFWDGCAPLWAWVHVVLALNAAAPELPPFISLKKISEEFEFQELTAFLLTFLT